MHLYENNYLEAIWVGVPFEIHNETALVMISTTTILYHPTQGNNRHPDCLISIMSLERDWMRENKMK